MKNNIDSYFKNKLDAPQNPPLDAWENIQSQIQQKERKRIFPLWMMFSTLGSVALLIIGITYFTNDSKTNNNLNSLEIDSEKSISNNNNNNKTSSELLNENSLSLNKNSATLNSSTVKEYEQTSISSFSTTSNSTINSTSEIFEKSELNSNEKIGILKSIQDLWNKYSSQNIANNSKVNPEKSFVEKPEFLQELFSVNKNFENSMVEIPEIQNENKKEVHKKKNKKIDFDRFHVSAFASPMALNTFVGSSMLSDEMKDFKTENSITLAYGVKGAYSLNPSVKIRTGISKVGFEQITKNVPLAVDMVQSPLATGFVSNNINYKSDIRISNELPSLVGGELSRSTMGNIYQQSEYIEIPLEAEIAILQTPSIGISATGGGSTWLLSKNQIYVHTEDYVEELGKANNVNKASFSANAGLKFDMKIMDNVQMNVEPNFKYLMNSVNNIEKYNPYTIGVNAGITVSLK